MEMQLCPHCMQTTFGDFCKVCGRNKEYQSNPLQLSAGTQLKGYHSYVVGAALGQGGFGITYIALDTTANRRVAIKEFYPVHCSGRTMDTTIVAVDGQLVDFEKGRERFLLEAQTMQRLEKIPSVVEVYDCFQSNNTVYLVMEYVEGQSLKSYMEKNGAFAPETFFPMVRPLLADIAAMHRQGVIHRDIAPDNIILDSKGRLRLIDFGTAREYMSQASMTVVVKKGFAPLEQYTRKGQCAATDVYALAATIYYCITGHVVPDSMDRIDEDTLKKPSEWGVQLPLHQEAALIRALGVRVKDRTQTADELLAELFREPPKPVSGQGSLSEELPEGKSIQNADMEKSGKEQKTEEKPSKPEQHSAKPGDAVSIRKEPAAPKKKKRTTLAAGLLALGIAAAAGIGVYGINHCIGEHSFSEWNTVQKAICISDGTEQRVCEKCGKTETRSLPKTGLHSYGEWKTEIEASCAEKGLELHTCSECGKTEERTVAKLTTHTWVYNAQTAQKECFCGLSEKPAGIAELTIETPARRSYYASGEQYDTTGLVLSAALDDGTTMQIKDGFTCDTYLLAGYGTKKITYTFQNKAISQTIELLDFYSMPDANLYSNFDKDYGKNDSGSLVKWWMMPCFEYHGNRVTSKIQENLSCGKGEWPSANTKADWENAKAGNGMHWQYSGDAEYEGGRNWKGCGYALPDDPSIAGEYFVEATFGDLVVTMRYTLKYEGNYSTGTGWSVSNVTRTYSTIYD